MSLQPGEILGHYRIVGKIGAGGMGEVYRATDTKLDRDVALKILPPDLAADPVRLERFRREAKAVAGLNHPHIVTLYAVEEVAGRSFLTMELVEGDSLDRHIEPGGMPLARVFDIGMALADALATAHGKQVVHRDLKPANVMLDAAGRVKVLDFGLARLGAQDAAGRPGATRASTADLPLTGEGVAVGTVPYMSPEQVQGRPVDARTDIYSLGVMLYEMITGRRPFRGENSAELVSAIMRDHPPPVDEIRRELPRHLGRIVAHCLQKKPDERYQSALDVRNELRGLAREVEAATSGAATPEAPAALPTPAPGTPGIPPEALLGTAPGSLPAGTPGGAVVGKPAALGRAGWWVGLAALAVVVLAGALLMWLPGATGGEGAEPDAIGAAVGDAAPAAGAGPGAGGAGATARPMIVVFPFENLGPPEEAYFAAGVTDEITTRLAGTRSLGVISRSSALSYDRAGRTMAEVGRDLGVTYVLEGTVRWDPGAGGRRVRVTPQLVEVASDTTVWTRSFEEDLEAIFEVQSQIAQQVMNELNLTLSPAERTRLTTRPTENLEAYRLYMRARNNSATSYYDPAHRLATIGLYRQAVELDPGFALAWAWLSYEHSYFYHLRFDATEERIHLSRQAVDRALALDPDLPEAHLALGAHFYRCYRDYEAAEGELLTAASLRPNDAELMSLLAAIRRRQGRWEESVAYALDSMALDPEDATQPWDLGVTYINMNRFDDALAMAERSIALEPGEGPPYGIRCLVHLRTGRLDLALEAVGAMPTQSDPFKQLLAYRAEMALRDFPAALQRAREFPVREYQAAVHIIARDELIGTALHMTGDEEAARTHLKAALTLLREELSRLPDDARAHTALGLVLAGLGSRDEAVAAGRRAMELYPVDLDAFHGPMHVMALAGIHLRFGELDPAVDLIESLLADPRTRCSPIVWDDPQWDPLRDDPRFADLRRRSLAP